MNTVFRVVLAMVLAVCIGANPVDSKSARPGGRFILQDHTGAFVTDQHFRGRFMLVTFGYTFCPDICPTNLINMTEALDQLESDSGKIAAIFITVDPERDTVRQLNGYMTAFHPDMVGLTGSEEMVDRIAATARRFAATPEQMAVTASVLGALAVTVGLFGSLRVDTPSGPSIVVAALGLFLVSLLPFRRNLWHKALNREAGS